MKIALVNDFLNQYGGSERVLEALAEVWPEAEIYTSLYDQELMQSWLKINPKRIHTNLIQRLPFAKALNKHYFFLYPLAFSLQSVGEADVVISISSFASKFVRVKRGGIHIAYINTPPRFLYGYDQELTGYKHRGFDKYLQPVYKTLVPPLKYMLRFADRRSIKHLDFVISNSQEIKKRVKKDYGVDSSVIYPPVDTNRFANDIAAVPVEPFYLIVSRLGGYKKINVAIDAFNQLGLSLKIIGAGPQLPSLKKLAKPNIEFLGRLSDEKVTTYLKTCKALVFPTEEDFGIVPVEAMAAGKPVIGYRKGGATETIIEDRTGVFFDEQSAQSIIEAVKQFEKMKFDPVLCAAQAEKFSKKTFQEKMRTLVETAYESRNTGV